MFLGSLSQELNRRGQDLTIIVFNKEGLIPFLVFNYDEETGNQSSIVLKVKESNSVQAK